MYAGGPEEGLRAFLACFDAEMLLYFDANLNKECQTDSYDNKFNIGVIPLVLIEWHWKSS